MPEPYDRAALEAAAIDLALRQHGRRLFALAGCAPRPSATSCRSRGSPTRRPRPAARATSRSRSTPIRTWDDATFAALADAGRVAVLDWKGGGTRADHERAHRLLPDALLEDPSWDAAPWSPGLARRLSADAPVLRAADVDRLPVAPAAVNLKPARMGGVLEALAAAAACAARGIAVYLGGMFELDVGRRQLQALAALLVAGRSQRRRTHRQDRRTRAATGAARRRRPDARLRTMSAAFVAWDAASVRAAGRTILDGSASTWPKARRWRSSGAAAPARPRRSGW